MCYSDDARPPLPPVGGAAANHGDLHLTAADGNRMMAYSARAEKPSRRGIVILPDVRGLHGFFKELTVRFAEAGIDAVAFDYFGRTAGDGSRDEGFDWKTHVGQTTPDGVAADVRAAVEYLRTEVGGNPGSIFTVGFCYGGRESWRQSARGHGLAGSIGFYGGQPTSLAAEIPAMKAPLLLLLAGEDHTPQEDFRQFEGLLKEAGVPFTSKTYEGAPHSFFDRTAEQHAEASADAWKQMLDFMAANSQ